MDAPRGATGMTGVAVLVPAPPPTSRLQRHADPTFLVMRLLAALGIIRLRRGTGGHRAVPAQSLRRSAA